MADRKDEVTTVIAARLDSSDNNSMGGHKDSSVHHLAAQEIQHIEEVRTLWRTIRYHLREPFAEFLGTCVMVLFLQGVVAQITLSQLKAGTYWSISVVTGVAATLGILVAGPVSGGHLNPSVTFSFVLFRKFPLRKVPGYIAGQLLGGFTGAALVYANYRSAIDMFEGHNIRTHKTAGIFSTYPQLYLSKSGQFFSEFLATGLLIMGIFAIFNPRSPKVIHDLAPLWIFLLIMNIGAALGFQTGYAMNAARDFAPRCLAYFVGYGSEVWSYGDFYSWVPVVAPLCGAFAGGLVYDLFIHEGDSPVNEPWMGLWPAPWLFGPSSKTRKTIDGHAC